MGYTYLRWGIVVKLNDYGMKCSQWGAEPSLVLPPESFEQFSRIICTGLLGKKAQPKAGLRLLEHWRAVARTQDTKYLIACKVG